MPLGPASGSGPVQIPHGTWQVGTVLLTRPPQFAERKNGPSAIPARLSKAITGPMRSCVTTLAFLVRLGAPHLNCGAAIRLREQVLQQKDCKFAAARYHVMGQGQSTRLRSSIEPSSTAYSHGNAAVMRKRPVRSLDAYSGLEADDGEWSGAALQASVLPHAAETRHEFFPILP